MKLLSRLFSKSKIDSRLVGSWIADSTEFNRTKVIFKRNGKLISEIYENDKTVIMNLIFETNGDFIISDQPSHPKIEKTKYNIYGDLLIMDFEGEFTKYKRIK
jgi:hypothetical protein